MSLTKHRITIDKSLQKKANNLFSKIYDQHELYAKTFQNLYKNFPVNVPYEIAIVKAYRVTSPHLKILLWELEVLMILKLLTESEAETLMSLLSSEDVSSQFIGLSILSNKLKEKDKLEKKGTAEEDFNKVISNYYDLVHLPAINKFAPHMFKQT
jgi:hypothetical protein